MVPVIQDTKDQQHEAGSFLYSVDEEDTSGSGEHGSHGGRSYKQQLQPILASCKSAHNNSDEKSYDLNMLEDNSRLSLCSEDFGDGSVTKEVCEVS